jgi:hypothetical protein
MRFITILLLVFSFVFLPCKGFAQQQSGNNQTSIQQGEPCTAGNVPIRIKLKNGDKVEGSLLEKTAEEVKVCRKGTTRLIAANDIKELKTKMTGSQRFTHSVKVISIFVGAVIAYGLLRYLSLKDEIGR